MVLEALPRISYICLLLCSSGFGYPFQTKVQTGAGGASTQGERLVTGAYPNRLGNYYSFSKSPGGGSGPGSGGTDSGSRRGGFGGTGVSGSRTSNFRSGSGLRAASSGFPIFRSFPWGHSFVVPPTFFNLNQVKLPRFLFGNPFNMNHVPRGSVVVPPPYPTSHVVQSSNGYQRAKSVLAHSAYSPQEWRILSLRSGQIQDLGQVKGWKKNVF